MRQLQAASSGEFPVQHTERQEVQPAAQARELRLERAAAHLGQEGTRLDQPESSPGPGPRALPVPGQPSCPCFKFLTLYSTTRKPLRTMLLYPLGRV
jgi:hypothetical protein